MTQERPRVGGRSGTAGKDVGPNASTPTRRWCRCQRELHELEQWRATHGISTPYYGGIHARAHAEGRCA
jgi:hypothetical protein